MTTLDLPPRTFVVRPGFKRASSTRRGYNAVMKLLRRVHLYSGLFMTPWVFLYGITATLFNHPTWFSDREVIEFGPAEVSETTLAQMPRPDELAAQLLSKLNTADPAGNYQLSPGSSASFTQPLTAVFQRDGKPYNLRMDLVTLEGSVREGAPRGSRGGPSAPTTPAERSGGEHRQGDRGADAAGESPQNRRQKDNGHPSGPASTVEPSRSGRSRSGAATRSSGESHRSRGPGDERIAELGALKQIPVAVEIPALQGVDRAVLTILNRLNVAASDLSVWFAPELVFLLSGHGQSWRARFDATGRTVTLTPATADSPRELPTRQFLLNLHKAHGYPASGGARWIWAIAVDGMFLAMCGWGLTGILMWWQMKNLRLIGGAILVVSAVTATCMIVAMHNVMT